VYISRIRSSCRRKGPLFCLYEDLQRCIPLSKCQEKILTTFLDNTLACQARRHGHDKFLGDRGRIHRMIWYAAMGCPLILLLMRDVQRCAHTVKVAGLNCFIVLFVVQGW
jgi:hypothetical protein